MKMSSFSILSLFLSLFIILSLVSAHRWDNFQNLTGSRLGDTNPAIVDLKKYLHHFGYLVSQHHTDSFDDELHAALRRYQQYFKLEVTGVIDPPTTQLLMTPRCGVPDIIPNVTSGDGKLHYSFFPGKPKWPTSRRQLTFAVVNGYSGISYEDVLESMSDAFQQWARVTDFIFDWTYPNYPHDIAIGFFRGDHGDGHPFDGRDGTLAHAFSPVDGRLHFDADEIWCSDHFCFFFSPSAYDLQSVAVHEIGHLLGLDHSTDSNAIMYPTIRPSTKKVNLAPDDIAGIRALYGYQPLDSTY